MLKSIYSAIMTKILRYQAESLVGLLMKNVNVLKYNPLSGSSYTKLPKRLYDSKKALIKIKYVLNGA